MLSANSACMLSMFRRRRHHLVTLVSETAGQLAVLALDGDTLGVDSAKKEKPLKEDKRNCFFILRDLHLRATLARGRGDRRGRGGSGRANLLKSITFSLVVVHLESGSGCGEDGRGDRRRGSGDRRKPITCGLVVIHLEQLLQPLLQEKTTLIGPVAVVPALSECQ